jgi:hypothetical protein
VFVLRQISTLVFADDRSGIPRQRDLRRRVMTQGEATVQNSIRQLARRPTHSGVRLKTVRHRTKVIR